MEDANETIRQLNDRIVVLEAVNIELREKNAELGCALQKAQDEVEAVKNHYAENSRALQSSYGDLKHHCDVLQAQVDIVKMIFA